jgi:DNA-binding SARP family transcriptional activator
MYYRLLDGLRADDDGRAVDLGGPKQRSVLAILLLEVGRVVTAERLIELLWGDEATKAHASLQTYVSNLRRALEPGRAARGPSAVIVTEHAGYRLAADRSAVDLHHFEDAVSAGRAVRAAGDLAEAVTIFDRAIGSVGRVVLPEFAGEAFVVAAARRHATVVATAVESLAGALLELGEPARAVASLELVIDDHPLREDLWSLYALALYRAGRQTDALRAVDRCRRQIADVAGLALGAELRRLERALLEQSPDLEWHAPVVPARGAPPRAGTPDSVATDDFVGRLAELAALEHALDTLTQGRGGVTVVLGEPGIGKTRLAEEAVRAAHRRGIVTAWSRCHEAGAPPFWPATELGRQLRLAGVLAADVVPGAGDSDLFGGEPPDSARARFRRRRTVLDALRSSPRPCVLVIDDLHWADPDSLRLLQDVLHELADVSVLVVLTTRPLTDDAPSGLVDLLAEVTRVPGGRQISLGALSRNDVAAWSQRWSDAPLPDEVIELVHDRSGGNALFVKDLVALLASDGRLRDAHDSPAFAAIPEGIHFVVRRRLSRLPMQTQRLLPVAAVLGRSIDVVALAAAAEQEPLDVLDALAPAIGAGLVVDDADELRFSHAVVADALASEVNAARRARLHAAAARARAAAAGADLGTAAAAVAHHALLGMVAGTGELAVTASIREPLTFALGRQPTPNPKRSGRAPPTSTQGSRPTGNGSQDVGYEYSYSSQSSRPAHHRRPLRDTSSDRSSTD